MALSNDQAADLAARLIEHRRQSLEPRDGHHGRIRRYLKGEHDLPYMPRTAKLEYRKLAEISRTNWIPLVPGTFVKGLYVDGYRAAKAKDNAPSWAYWQANGLDARQSIAHRGALEYGTSYVLVLKGSPAPYIRPLRPTRAFAFYEDDDAEYPDHGLHVTGRDVDGGLLFDLYDATTVYTGVVAKGDTKPTIVSTAEHGMGVTPWVRFRDRLDDEAEGVVKALIPVQDRVNLAVFNLNIALQYASFRQRWATGLAIPEDLDEFLADGVTPNPNFGKPSEPFQSAIDRLWVSDSQDAAFGDFAQTEVSGHLQAYDSAVRTLASLGNISPLILLGDLVNVSAEAFASIKDSERSQIDEYATLFGEAWEQVFRLAAKAAGAPTADNDNAAVRWRDTEARSFAATVDALGKMVQMLGVPAEGAWERVPGVTDDDITRWRAMASANDGMKALADAISRQGATPNPPPAQQTPPPAANAAPSAA